MKKTDWLWIYKFHCCLQPSQFTKMQQINWHRQRWVCQRQKCCYIIYFLWYTFCFWDTWAFIGEAHALDPQKRGNWLCVFKEPCYKHKHLADFLKSQISECLGSSQHWLVMVANEKDFLTQIAEVWSLCRLGTWAQGTVSICNFRASPQGHN